MCAVNVSKCASSCHLVKYERKIFSPLQSITDTNCGSQPSLCILLIVIPKSFDADRSAPRFANPVSPFLTYFACAFRRSSEVWISSKTVSTAPATETSRSLRFAQENFLAIVRTRRITNARIARLGLSDFGRPTSEAKAQIFPLLTNPPLPHTPSQLRPYPRPP